MDIAGGMFLADGTEAKVVTGVDDHSRCCVIASVVTRATGRAACLAFASALREFGVPDEVLTGNGKQFTDRVWQGRGGAVRPDLPRQRDHPPADPAAAPGHDREG
jgi:transposase InsO family protein